MNLNFSSKRKRNGVLLLILFIAAIIRFYHLRYQSFGLDELHTMNEADPSIPWKDMFGYLRNVDQHPPLFFIIERILFTIFGSSERVGRGFTALCGVLGVWAMYLLGRELLSKRLGLLAAAFTCINYFCIFYSQETRDYILAFLLSAVSYRYFIRLLRYLDKKDMWLYALSTLGVMYSHYFGMLVACSQFVIAFILLFAEKDRKPFIRCFLISGLIMAVGFSVWLPFLTHWSNVTSFWVHPLTEEFIYAIFGEYFGNAALLMPILVTGLLFYVIRVFWKSEQNWTETKKDPLLLGFVLFTLSLLVVYMIPYIRSVLVVPMLISRYTIVVLPVVLLAFAYGIELIPNNFIRGIVTATFLLLSLIDLLIVKNFYGTSRNTRFRELTMSMVDTTTTQYPVLNDRTGWQQGYYLRKFGYKGPVMGFALPEMIDSIFKRNASRDTVSGFWIVNAFFEPGQGSAPDPARQAAIDKEYTLVRDVRYYDAQGKLYLRPTSTLDTADFAKTALFTLDNERVVAVWGAEVTSNPFPLRKGSYLISVNAKGQEGGNMWPHLIASLNGRSLGGCSPEDSFSPHLYLCSVPEDTDTARLSFQLDNDYWDPVTHEDRNAFIRSITFIRQ